LISGSLLSLTSIIDLVNFGLIAAIGLDHQFHRPQAHCHHWPQLSIALASSSLPSSASIVNFIGLKHITIVSLDCQFHWPQAPCCHWP
jgi:hypothetical protein